MMKPAEDRDRNDLSAGLGDRPRCGGSKRYISNKYSSGGTLVVFQLDSLIEEKVRGINVAPLPQDERQAILHAVRSEVDLLPPSVSIPAILTTADIRASVRELVADEFPRMPVLAYYELPPGLKVQPIARISLE